ncbi:hypothetical protein BJX61DRAFT_218042 [Aspergillus egyptiacus]|nr:hypothetical protein BJX61DRAFT_218042 [Aspergillus egyptiacus]
MSLYSDDQSRHSSVPPSAQPYRSIFGGTSQDDFDQDGHSEEDDLGYTELGGANTALTTEHDESDDDPAYVLPPAEPSDYSKEDDNRHVQRTLRTRGHVDVSSSPPPYRSNRFHGPADLWLDLTRADREIVVSLEETRARDLAAHLYNACALQKQEFANLEKEEAERLVEGDTKDSELEGSDLLRILEEWMAWPMFSDEAPRPDERLRRLEDDKWTFRMKKPDPRPSAELEECIVAILMRTAKDRFCSRIWDSPINRRAPARPGADGLKSDTDGGLGSDQEDEDDGNSVLEGESEQESMRLVQRPIIQVDEDESRRKLRPLARNVISQFERLLIALDRFNGSSESEDGRSRRTGSRGRKRARSSSLVSDKSDAYFGYDKTEDASDAEHQIAIPSSRQDWAKLASDRSQSRGRKRLRRPSQQPQRRSRISRLRSVSAHSNVQTGLTDWKDVVGIASMICLPPAVIQRAIQRFSALFGEDKEPPEVPQYPDQEFMTSVLQWISTGASTADLDNDESIPRSFASPLPSYLGASTRKRSTSQANKANLGAADKAPSSKDNSTQRESPLVCPFKACRRHEKGFSRRWNLNQHLKVMHPSYHLKDSKSHRRNETRSGYDSDGSE